jgi:hypothetical protein
LIQKERHLEDVIKEKQKELDNLILKNSELIQEQLSKMREKETQNFIKNETEIRKIRVIEEKAKDQDRELINKLKDVDNFKKESKEHFERELDIFKNAYELSHSKEKTEFVEKKQFFEEQQKLFQEYKISFLRIESENEMMKKEIYGLKVLIDHKEVSLKSVQKENEMIRDELRSVNFSFKSTSRKLDMKILKVVNLKEQIYQMRK